MRRYGKYGDYEFANGAATFTLKDKEQASFWDMPQGTKFRVTETDSQGLVVWVGEGQTSEKSDDGSYEGVTRGEGSYTLVTFTNKKPETGSLKLKKLVTVNEQETTGKLADGTYVFTITGPGEDGDVEKTVEITVDKGVAVSAKVDGENAALDSDKYVEVTDLIAGEYTITETAPTNGTRLVGENGRKVTVVAGKTGTDVSAKAEFINNVDVVDIEVDKKWANADGSEDWPEGVEVDIQLTADGDAVSGKTATLTKDQPSYKFENLPKYQADGETEIEYGVEEAEVKGYATEVGDLTDGKVTITNTQETTEIEVDKKWANADGSEDWPEGVEVDIQLTADGDSVSGKTATLSADQPSHKFDKLPKYQADGETEIAYSVEEADVKGYASEVGDLTDGRITITNTQETTEITVDKKWVNADGSEDWPEDVEVGIQLTANGQAVEGKTATLTEEVPSHTFESLPKYDKNGNEITYSVSEVKVPGYSSFAGTVKDGRITITNTQGTTQIEVDKKWANADGTDTWPEGVTVEIQLTADGEAVAGKTATLSADEPSHLFKSLPMYRKDGKTEIAYSVEELEVTGYKSEVGETTTGRVTITNTQEATEVTVERQRQGA